MVHIDDEFIQYYTDLFNWVNSFNPSIMKKSMGLNYYGITVSECDSCKKILKILDGLRIIYESVPEVVRAERSICFHR